MSNSHFPFLTLYGEHTLFSNRRINNYYYNPVCTHLMKYTNSAWEPAQRGSPVQEEADGAVKSFHCKYDLSGLPPGSLELTKHMHKRQNTACFSPSPRFLSLKNINSQFQPKKPTNCLFIHDPCCFLENSQLETVKIPYLALNIFQKTNKQKTHTHIK